MKKLSRIEYFSRVRRIILAFDIIFFNWKIYSYNKKCYPFRCLGTVGSTYSFVWSWIKYLPHSTFSFNHLDVIAEEGVEAEANEDDSKKGRASICSLALTGCGVLIWLKPAWRHFLCRFRRGYTPKHRKRLSANYSGKDDIQVTARYIWSRVVDVKFVDPVPWGIQHLLAGLWSGSLFNGILNPDLSVQI